MGAHRRYPAKDRRRRKCLRCLKRFMSDGPGHQRCRRCHTLLELTDDLTEDDSDEGYRVARHVDIDPPGFGL